MIEVVRDSCRSVRSVVWAASLACVRLWFSCLRVCGVLLGLEFDGGDEYLDDPAMYEFNYRRYTSRWCQSM